MKKCKGLKNPCKICLETVSPKNGIQCKGACQSWVHYKCLNYTPGRIKDIQTGVIHVNCPCPDCSTGYPREFRTDKPFSCTNNKCPAKNPCTNEDCPSNQDTINQTSRHSMYPSLKKCAKGQCADNIIPASLSNISLATNGSVPACEYSGDGRMPIQSPNQCPNQYPNQHANQYPNQYPNPYSTDAIKTLCNTVGQLTNQLNNLVNQIANADPNTRGQPLRPTRPCLEADAAPIPKPCYCPGNPPCKK